ncbi:MAG: hypothetical protein QXL96_12465 [Ignisphaera sp.]
MNYLKDRVNGSGSFNKKLLFQFYRKTQFVVGYKAFGERFRG